ncbi:hypothetical protein AVEN_70184-1 [Araneus ventricosus]|uniref:Uncharacterized protein n=1 Tax=Araneus ventricosus TaxID=182803 RepID=A0A4Y2FBU0_ARAVE|nr:hypothetical protein AVEN_70184-1 [Araneus ventricosus]
MRDEHRRIMPTTLKLMLLFYFAEREYFLNVFEERLQYISSGVVMQVLAMIFHIYHSETVKDDDYRNIFVHIWRLIPASTKNYILETDFSGHKLALLIRDHFPFLLRKDAFKKIAELTSLDSKPSNSLTPFGLLRDKWEFLNFLIEEVVTIPNLKMYRSGIMLDLKIRNSNKAAWNRVLRFVRKIGSRNRQ